MNKTSFGDNGTSYKLDLTGMEKQTRAVIGKQAVPVQVYYRLPRETEWCLGYMLVQDYRVTFAKGFQDLSNDHMNFDTSFVLHGCNVSLIDDVWPHILIERKTYIDGLSVALQFNAVGERDTPFPCDRYRFASLGTEALFHHLNLAANRDIPTEESDVQENCGLSKFVFKSLKMKLNSTEIYEALKGNQLYVQIRASPYTEYVRLAIQDLEFQPTASTTLSPFQGGSFNWQVLNNPTERTVFM